MSSRRRVDHVMSVTAGCLCVFIALFCPCSLRSFPMLYVAFARRVKRPTGGGDRRPSFTAPSVITAVSQLPVPLIQPRIRAAATARPPPAGGFWVKRSPVSPLNPCHVTSRPPVLLGHEQRAGVCDPDLPLAVHGV